MDEQKKIVEKIARIILTASSNELSVMQTGTVLQKINFSRTYSSNLLKKYTKFSIYEFIEQEKMYRIRLKISENKNYTIENACSEFGICKQDHVIEKFKKKYIVTPGIYKKMHHERII